MAGIGAKAGNGVLIACLLLLLLGGGVTFGFISGWFDGERNGQDNNPGAQDEPLVAGHGLRGSPNTALVHGGPSLTTNNDAPLLPQGPDSTGVANPPAASNSSSTVPVDASRQDAPPQARATVEIRGAVQTPEGLPVEGAKVEVYRRLDYGEAFDENLGGLLGTATTGKDGAYRVVAAIDRLLTGGPGNSGAYVLRLNAAASEPRLGDGMSRLDLQWTPSAAPLRGQMALEPIVLRKAFMVRVHVQNETGAPVAGVTCTWVDISLSPWSVARLPNGSPIAATTDVAGNAEFSLPRLDDDRWSAYNYGGAKRIVAAAPGYGLAASDELRLDNNRPDQRIERTIVLPHGVTVSGRLLNALTGAPLTDTSFQFALNAKPVQRFLPIDGGGASPPASMLGALRTDAQGRFQIESVPLTQRDGTVFVKDFDPAFVCFTGDTPLDIAMLPTTLIRVRFEDERTASVLSVESITVRASGKEKTEWLGEGTHGVELDPGFVVADLAPGQERTVTLKPSFAGYAKAFTADIVLRRGEAVDKTISVPASFFQGLTISGVVIDERGAPIPQAHVTLYPPMITADDSMDDAPIYRATSHTDGSFKFAALDAGSYTLSARAKGYDDDGRSIQLSADTELKIELRRGGMISVHISTSAKDEASELHVRTWNAPIRQRGLRLSFDPDIRAYSGACYWPGTPPENISVIIETNAFITLSLAPGDPLARPLMADSEGNYTVTFDSLPPSVRLKGTLADASGKPLAKVSFRLARIAPGAKNLSFGSYSDKTQFHTDERGAFDAPGLFPGHYVMAIETDARRRTVVVDLNDQPDQYRDITLRAE